MLKATIVSGIMAGSIAFGALVTYNGGAAIDLAQSKITQQAEQLGLFKSQQTRMVEKLTATKERLAYLEANGTEADQAEIDQLNQEATTLEANINTSGEQIADRINALEGEINKANTDAAELQATVVAAGETKLAMTESQMDRLLDEVPAGFEFLKMINGTPQPVKKADGTATKLIIDKTSGDINTAHLNIWNEGVQNFYVQVEGQPEKALTGGETYDFGDVRSLDGKTVIVLDAYRMEVGKYYLMAE